MAKWNFRFYCIKRGEVDHALQWPSFDRVERDVTVEGPHFGQALKKAKKTVDQEFWKERPIDRTRWVYMGYQRVDKESPYKDHQENVFLPLPVDDSDELLVKAVRRWLRRRFDGIGVNWKDLWYGGFEFKFYDDIPFWEGSLGKLDTMMQAHLAILQEFKEAEIRFWKNVPRGRTLQRRHLNYIRDVLPLFWEAYLGNPGENNPFEDDE